MSDVETTALTFTIDDTAVAGVIRVPGGVGDGQQAGVVLRPRS